MNQQRITQHKRFIPTAIGTHPNPDFAGISDARKTLGSRLDSHSPELLVDIFTWPGVMNNNLTLGRDDFVDNPILSTFDSHMEGA